MQDKSILITGGSGFLGKHLIRKLLKEYKHIRIVNIINKNKTGIKEVIEKKVDINSLGEIENLLKSENVKTVIHTAAALGWNKSPYSYFYKVNTLFTKNLALAAEKTNIEKFIYISSSGVYGKGTKERIIDEKQAPSPSDSYEKTKYLGEIEVLKLKEKLNIIILRPGWIYGPEDKRTLKLFKVINTGFFPKISGDVAVQTPVFVDDVVEAIILSLNKDIQSGTILNIAGEEILLTTEIVEKSAKILGKRLLPFPIPLKLLKSLAATFDFIFKPFNFSPPITRSKLAFFERSKPLSIEKARKVLGYNPKYKFDEGIKITLLWYKKNGWI